MSKAVLISIQPKWCELIASGKKTVEVRKTRPKLETPFKVYIYCTKPSKKHQTICDCMVINDDELYRLPTGEVKYGCSLELMGYWSGQYSEDNFLNGKIIGEFICDKIDEYVYAYCTHPEIGMDYDCGDNWWEMDDEDLKRACLTEAEFRYYASGNQLMYGWHISHLKIYDTPRALNTLSTIDTVAVKKCEYRERVFNNPDLVNGAWLPGSFVCNRDELDWCSKCKTKPIVRPPQSWCYVEELS